MLKTLKLCFGSLAALLLLTLFARANELPDKIKLRSGAELRVKIIDTPKINNRSHVLFKTESGATVQMERTRISNLLKADEANEAYARHLKTRQETVAWHREIIDWCKSQPKGRLKFRDEIRYHLEMILQIDPQDLKARKLLGYERVGQGQWMLEDLLFDRYGYQRDGATVTPKLFERIDQGDQQADVASGAFKKQLKLWLKDVKKGRGSRRDLKQRLFQLCTPQTANFIFEEHAREEKRNQVRSLYVEAFGASPSNASTRALVHFSVNDPVEEIRELAGTLLQQPEFDQRRAMERMSEFLGSTNNGVINSSAQAIRELVSDDDSQRTQLRDVMLRLTDALVTTHVVPIAGARRPGGFELNQNSLGGTSFTAGDEPQTENRTLQNGSVLSALKKLTGEDFGYNEKRWEQYFIENYSLVDATVRTD